jgi:hypothetical protein
MFSPFTNIPNLSLPFNLKPVCNFDLRFGEVVFTLQQAGSRCYLKASGSKLQ